MDKEGDEKGTDVFRDTPVRLLGKRSYANEVGEAFRALVPVNAVRLSYVVASSYVVADACDKSHAVYHKFAEHKQVRAQKVTIAAVDTLIWQAFASVIVPGFTINRLCFATGILLKRMTSLPSPVRKWTTTAVGLAAIPLIFRPIDRGVERVMDETLRKCYSLS